MVSRRGVDVLALAGVVTLSRFVFRSHFLYDLDSVNFALGIGRFDPRVHQPHPPGYFLYICLGRLLNWFVHDANLALVLLSILSSCGAVVLIYLLAFDWFGERSARFAGILFVLSPLGWFHGIVALTYSVEAFFSALLGYLCWRLERGSRGFLLPASVVLGVACGVRPSSLLFLGPLFLFSLRSQGARRAAAGIAFLVLTLLAWFVPMLAASGGIHAYFDALFSLWRMVPSKATVFNSSPLTSVARAFTILFIYSLAFGAASVLPLQALRKSGAADRRHKLFTLVWMTPALCFFTFIFLQFVNSGYLLLLAAPACIWLGHWASEWYVSSGWPRPLKIGLMAMGAVANVAIFLFAPFYCSYRSVRQFEAELAAVRATLPQVAPPASTLIVAFDSHFLGFRHAGYYLPGYVTVEYPELKSSEGARVFVMHNRDTDLLAALPVGCYTRFVLFPLPAGSASYRSYLKAVEEKLPRGDLQVVRLGGHDYVTGPVSDLHSLFPDVTAARQVYSDRVTRKPPL